MEEYEIKRSLVESPGYQGPERRDRLVIGPCECHLKHTRILQEHDEQIKNIKEHNEARDKYIDDRTERQHFNMWEGIKKKVSNKLFYLYISVYSGLFILGIVSVYTGMHNNALAFKEELTKVRVIQAEIKTGLEASSKMTDQRIGDLKEDIKDLRKDLKKP